MSKNIKREFDPGSGRTLAACLTHASRAIYIASPNVEIVPKRICPGIEEQV